MQASGGSGLGVHRLLRQSQRLMGKSLQDPECTMHQRVLGIIELQGTGSLPINGEFRLRQTHSKISKKILARRQEPNFLSLPKLSRLHPSSLGNGGAEEAGGWRGAWSGRGPKGLGWSSTLPLPLPAAPSSNPPLRIRNLLRP